MAAVERHIYPGNNTPLGFFSYYQHILGQKEANRIICIKGGPGVGKSTFMKKIGAEFLERGEDVDFMHCSSDNDSLDGVVLKSKRIAFVDGTAPHVCDPINPGAVDSIVHLGDFWNEEGIRKNKTILIETNEQIKKCFDHAYNYLAAAGKIYENIESVYDGAVEKAEIYKMTARIVSTELGSKEICLKPGNVKKFFASAITPNGFQNNIKSLIKGYRRVYLITAPVGISSESLLSIFSESAMYRGYNVEEYYCPMKPKDKVEHLLIPEMGIAFISVNKYHDLEPWSLTESSSEDVSEENYPDVTMIDVNDMIAWNKVEKQKEFLEKNQNQLDNFLNEAIICLSKAKKKHDVLENFYIPNMDFKKIEALRNEIIAKIE